MPIHRRDEAGGGKSRGPPRLGAERCFASVSARSDSALLSPGSSIAPLIASNKVGGFCATNLYTVRGGMERSRGRPSFPFPSDLHLLEAGVEVNVIRGWLGHVSLDTTNRYAEINIRSKEAALQACAPPSTTSAAFPRRPVWRDDTALLDWLASL
jgi:hypothetical protein